MNKKILLVLMVFTIGLIIFGTINTSAATVVASGNCGSNVNWTLDDNGTLSINGKGEMHNFSYDFINDTSSAPWASKHSDIIKVTIDEGITRIGNNAFYWCENLVSVTIPDSVTSIGSAAFYCSPNLKRVDISDLSAWCKISFGESGANPLWYSGNLYLNGNLVTNLTIPNDVTTVNNYAFSGCGSIVTITIPDSITSIGSFAFERCANLTNIALPNSVTNIGSFAFSDCNGLKDVYYNGTEEEWYKISISSYNDPLKNATIHFITNIQEAYRINSIILKDMYGNNLQSIPTGMFLATVSFTNVSSSADTVIILAQYTDAGAFNGLMYIQTEDVPTGSTIKLSIPVDNSNGDVAKLKAFCWESFGSLTPMGNSVSFPVEQ